MTESAEDCANAYRIGRVCGLLLEPGSDRRRANAAVCDLLLGRFHKQARAEGLDHEKIELMLAAVEEAVEEAKLKIEQRN
jgi:hypothetical protein